MNRSSERGGCAESGRLSALWFGMYWSCTSYLVGVNVTCHISSAILLCNAIEMPRKNPPPSCQPTKLNVGAIASELRISTRQLARLAKKGVPGVKKGPGGYQFLWLDIPETRAWIAERKRFRKGNRKRPEKRKGRSKAQLFAQMVRRIEKEVTFHLRAGFENPTSSELDTLNSGVRRLQTNFNHVLTRIGLERQASEASGR